MFHKKKNISVDLTFIDLLLVCRVLVLQIAFCLLLIACKSKSGSVKVDPSSYYTCSMHPQIMEDKPGLCPICHMDLIVVKKTNTGADEIMLNDEQVKLGNIRTDTLRNSMIGDRTVLTATLNTDETKVNSVNARVMGRIDRLYFKSVGDYVAKGAHLYDLYSEELNNAKQEYLATLERKQTLDNSIIDFTRLLQSAKTKLLLWGMSEPQISELAKSKKALPVTAFFATASGHITELPVMEGQYVMEGGTVVKLVDLSTLWAEAQVYSSQLSAIDNKGLVTVEFPDLPGKEIKGKIEFVNPEISLDSRVNLARVTIQNPNGFFKAGMPAYVIVKNKSENALTLPIDAVLRNGTSNTVWVQTGKNNFKMKMVETGLESGDRIEITSGLQNGDVVVISGAYLLHSEFVFKKGSDPMAGMKM